MPEERVLTRGDLAAGTALGAVMLAGLVALSNGRSLLVTLVPGLIVAWGLFVWMGVQAVPLPAPRRLLPLYFGLLGFQLLHFAEELATGFPVRFPALYGGVPYATDTFVILNLAAYALFAAAAVLSLVRGLRFAVLPALFFVVYGGIGNAVAHITWTVLFGEYFPGFLTAVVYCAAAPWVLYRFTDRRRWAVVAVVLALALGLPPLLVAGAESGAFSR